MTPIPLIFRTACVLAAVGLLVSSRVVAAADPAPMPASPAIPTSKAPEAARLEPCRLDGVEHDALCGSVRRSLDPSKPNGTQIDVHFAVLPAVARRKLPDPVFFFAGGPGQSAIGLAGLLARQLARFSNRRDIVLIDQRGTGRSAPLDCEKQSAARPLADVVDNAKQIERLAACRKALEKRPYGDLRQFTTTIAMADADAVRQALGADRVNVIGGSYGTRAALEYMRLFPRSVRRAVIDGVAPPDMAMPASFSTDNQAAFDALIAACEQNAACKARHPDLRAHWQSLLAGLPRDVTVRHPLTGREERLHVDRDIVLGLVRLPLYSPMLAAALPYAIDEAAAGRFEAMVGIGNAMGGNPALDLAEGMHFSVVCAEDAPRMAEATDAPGADFGNAFAALYRSVCADWPKGAVPAAFYTVPPAPAPTLVLSGAIDPVTPPRHGERVAKALGPLARHVVVPNAGHGVSALPCMRDAVFKFVDAETDEEAMKVDLGCATQLPRPLPFEPVEAAP